VSDGVSKTYMIFESAGRPLQFTRGVQTGEMGPLSRSSNNPSTPTVTIPQKDTQWADDRVYALWGNVQPGGTCPITAVMNCENYSEIYSFHPGGAHILSGDCSVSFVNEDISVDAFITQFTATAGDTVQQ